jgi:hypothetical protein
MWYENRPIPIPGLRRGERCVKRRAMEREQESNKNGSNVVKLINNKPTNKESTKNQQRTNKEPTKQRTNNHPTTQPPLTQFLVAGQFVTIQFIPHVVSFFHRQGRHSAQIRHVHPSPRFQQIVTALFQRDGPNIDQRVHPCYTEMQFPKGMGRFEHSQSEFQNSSQHGGNGATTAPRNNKVSHKYTNIILDHTCYNQKRTVKDRIRLGKCSTVNHETMAS